MGNTARTVPCESLTTCGISAYPRPLDRGWHNSARARRRDAQSFRMDIHGTAFARPIPMKRAVRRIALMVPMLGLPVACGGATFSTGETEQG
jgi:hypothetical protein